MKYRMFLRSVGASTLLELLLVTCLIGLLSAIALPVFSHVRKNGDMANETAAARQLRLAYSNFAAENDGQLMPGYASLPANDDKGNELHSPVSDRYPWLLAPYLSYDLRILYGKVGDSRLGLNRERDYGSFVYAVSVVPAFEMNTVYVGSDHKTLHPDIPRAQAAYGQFCVTRMAQAERPALLIVFASACFDNNGERMPGYYKVEAPCFVTGLKWASKYSPEVPAESFGHVDCRYNEPAIVAMLDGHVELLDFKQMNDMRRWSNLSAQANESGWIPGGAATHSTSSSGSSGSTSAGEVIDGKPKNENL